MWSDGMKGSGRVGSVGGEDAASLPPPLDPLLLCNAPLSVGPSVSDPLLQSKRKNTSFKITNILPSRPPSNDPEESGEDDPDDSHTEDISDGPELPAQPSKKFMSTMRRNSFDAAASAAAAVVAAGGSKEAAVSILSSNGLPASAMSVLNEAVPVFSKNAKWVSSVLAVSHPNNSIDARHGPRDRFKVVRMETNIPLKRGRWTCIDYIDKRTISSNSTVVSDKNELTDNGEHEEERPSPHTSVTTSSTVPSSSSQHIPNFSSIAEPVRMSSNPQTPSVVQSPSTAPPSYPTSASQHQQQMFQQLLQKQPNPQQVIQFAATPVTCQSMIKQQQQSLLLPQQQTSTNLVSSSGSGHHTQPVPSPQMSTHHQQLILEGGASISSSLITPLTFGGLMSTSSAVNSIPPSRAETDILPPTTFYPAHFDHPIDNEHLVERLEEISTQQNAPFVEEDIDNSCEIQNSYGNRGYTTNSNNNQFGNMYHQQQTQIQQQGNFQYNHHQQYPQGSRYLSRPESTGPYNNNINNYPPSSSGLSRYTSRGVSPVKERPPAQPSTNTTDGTNHSLFASFYRFISKGINAV
nr:protein bunched, class 2/F/G isoform-like isoform X2 [Lepeophtheirus salmonis]